MFKISNSARDVETQHWLHLDLLYKLVVSLLTCKGLLNWTYIVVYNNKWLKYTGSAKSFLAVVLVFLLDF